MIFTLTRNSQTTLGNESSFKMNPDATFVIAGGLGGIGRASARWMAERGAKNIVLLSRSGPRADSARELIKDLQAMGVRVETPACNIADLETVKQVFDRLSVDMPPVKGLLQASVISKVSAASLQRCLFTFHSFSGLLRLTKVNNNRTGFSKT